MGGNSPGPRRAMNPLLKFIFILLAALPLVAQDTPLEYKRNLADEPLAKEFSKQRAVDFIEHSVTRWQTRRKCITCHTNGLHLVAAAKATPLSPVLADNRTFARDYLTSYVSEGREPRGQSGAIEGLVASASFLTISEMSTERKLHPETAAALDHIWTQQDPSGAWNNWLKCHWGPFEVDDHFGVTLASIALNMTPDAYRNKPTSRQANENLRRYLTQHPPNSLHQKGMLIWASVHDPALITAEQRKSWIEQLKHLQNEDGGWTLIDLGNHDWIREDGKPHHRDSDGYATAFSLFVLRQAGIPVNDPGIQRGLTWLKSNQRQSGRWFTHSPRRDGKHYITQAATNMALLALAACHEEPE